MRLRRKDLEIHDPEIIEQILSEGVVCRLVMNDGEVPYLLPFNYGYKDHCIYIHSAPEGKKIDLLKMDNKVRFEITSIAELITGEAACDWAMKYRSVIGIGEVEILTDSKDKIDGLNVLMKHNGFTGDFEYHEKHLANVVILKLMIQEMTAKQSSDWMSDKG